MIPKRAIFCWSSTEPISWLRRQSIASFARLNPDWTVVVEAGVWPSGEGFRFDVIRSDYARYQALANDGGVYFDTDIVFVRPIPDEWLNAPSFAPLGCNRNIEHIACLGGDPSDGFWQKVVERCQLRQDMGIPLDCQAFGVKLLNKMKIPEEMRGIPPESFLTHPWDKIELLWADISQPIQPWVVGVHWYGGDRLSQDMERVFSETSRPQCIVSDALVWEPK